MHVMIVFFTISLVKKKVTKMSGGDVKVRMSIYFYLVLAVLRLD